MMVPDIRGLDAPGATFHAGVLQPAGGTSTATSGVQPGERTGFESMLREMLQTANAHQGQADQAVHDLLAGKTDNIHDVVLSLSKAEMSFGFLLEVRNRVVDSYNELMRMQM